MSGSSLMDPLVCDGDISFPAAATFAIGLMQCTWTRVPAAVSLSSAACSLCRNYDFASQQR